MQKHVNMFMINFAIKSSFICVLYLVLFNMHYTLTPLWVSFLGGAEQNCPAPNILSFANAIVLKLARNIPHSIWI